MNQIIDKIRPVFLYIVLLNAGLYAGLHVEGILNPIAFGIINFKGDLMPSVEWAARWQIIDGFMRVRMGVVGPVILWSYVLTILLFVRRWKSVTFWLLTVAFSLFIADIILTAQQQIPINRYIEKLDFKRLTNEQINTLSVLHRQVIENFKGREWFAIMGFAAVALAPFFWQKAGNNMRRQIP